MKYATLAAVLLFAAATPATTAMTIDDDERALYDSSIQCMAFYGLMAVLGSEGEAEDPDLVKSGTNSLRSRPCSPTRTMPSSRRTSAGR